MIYQTRQKNESSPRSTQLDPHVQNDMFEDINKALRKGAADPMSNVCTTASMFR